MGTFSNALKASVMLAIVLVEHAGAARVQVPHNDSHTHQPGSEFVCPSQCLECCDSTSFGGLFSTPSFKCILRDPAKVPEEKGRECQPPKPRNPWYAPHHKTHCKYIGNEKRDTQKKCSDKFICCCSENQNWNEERCFPGAQEGTRKEVANHKMELFVMSWQTNVTANAQLYTNKGACKGEGHTHHVYDTSGQRAPFASEDPGSLSRQTSGCCLATQTTNVRHHWTTTHQDGSATRMNEPARMVITQRHKDMTYVTCKQHELLHACSNDGGLTASGEFKYKRKVQGTCLGEEQSTMVGDVAKKLEQYGTACPNDMFEDSWCECNNGADPAQQGCAVCSSFLSTKFPVRECTQASGAI